MRPAVGMPIVGSVSSFKRLGSRKSAMVLSAAAMYGGATAAGLIEAAIPGGTAFSLVPGLAALALLPFLVIYGPRLPEAVLAGLGPLGVAGIGLALATTEGTTDGAVLYVWPVLWGSVFFGRNAAIGIVGWVGVVQAVVLISLPAGAGNVDRWIDVMISMSVVALVAHVLAARNEELVRKLAAEARIDSLTGLLNRRGFDERAGVELRRAQREQTPIAVVSFDIDYFKRVNDEWGHETGDRMLAHLGDVFREQTRGTDLVARMGGEEFVALLSSANVAEGHAYSERVRAAFTDVDGLDLPRATISVGVTAGAAPGELDTLLQVADSALYEAKCSGRDRTIVHRMHRERALEPVGVSLVPSG
jgi:diguanylate cyclase (GGDEF)-like protein